MDTAYPGKIRAIELMSSPSWAAPSNPRRKYITVGRRSITKTLKNTVKNWAPDSVEKRNEVAYVKGTMATG